MIHHEGHEVHEEVIKNYYLIYLFILRVLRGVNIYVLADVSVKSRLLSNEDGEWNQNSFLR